MLYYAVLLVFFFEYFRPENYLSALKNSFLLPLGLFILSVAIENKERLRNTDLLNAKNTKALLFYLLLIILSAATADVTLYVWQYFTGAIGYFMLYVLIAKEVNDLSKMKGLFILLISLHILVVIVNPDILLHPETRSYMTKSSPFLGDGNDFAWSVCIVLPFTLFLYMTVSSRVKKIICIMAFVALTLCLVGTQSRGAMLAFTAIVIYQWMKSNKKALGAIAASILVIIILSFAPSAFFERMNSVKDYETDGSAQGRILAWTSAVRMAVSNPLFGVGADHFAVKFGTEFRPPGVGRTDMPWINAHSMYFKILGEFGLPGIAFLLYLIFSNFKSTGRMAAYFSAQGDKQSLVYRNLCICLNSSLIGFAICGVFLSGIKYPHLFVLAGLITASNYIVKKRDGLPISTNIRTVY